MVNSINDRHRRIRQWRDNTHPGNPAINATHWHDVNLLLNRLEQSEAIVSALAEAAAFDECVFCPSTSGELSDHAESCPYRLARELTGDSE